MIWNLETIQQYYDEHNAGVKVLDTWMNTDTKTPTRYVKLLLPNGQEINKCWKSQLTKQSNDFIQCYTNDDIVAIFNKHGYKLLNITEYQTKETPMSCMDKNGFKYKISLLDVNELNRKHRLFDKNNPYRDENLLLYCKLYCPSVTPLENIKDTKNKMKFSYTIGTNKYYFETTLNKFTQEQIWKKYLTKPTNISAESAILYRHIIAAGKNCVCEYSFDNLRGHKQQPLRFDFAIIENDKLLCLIEYDSILHFDKNNALVKDNYRAYWSRDAQKNSYCLANNIPLYRISCWDLPNILNYDDIINDKYRVKSRWHNYDIILAHGLSIH